MITTQNYLNQNMDPNVIRANIGPGSGLLTGTESIYLQRNDGMPQVQSLIPEVQTFVDINPVNTQSVRFDNQAIFELQQQIPLLVNMTLILTLSPVAVTGGTYARWSRDFLTYMFKRITFYDTARGQYIQYTPSFTETWIETLCFTEQLAINKQLYRDLPDASYSTIAATGATFYVPIRCWINERREYAMRTQNLDTPFNLKIEFEKLSNLIVTDGTNPTATIDSCVLSLEGYIPTESERNTSNAILNSKSGQLLRMRSGFDAEICIVPAGFQGTKLVPIDYFKGQLRRLNFKFRKTSDLNQNIRDRYDSSVYPNSYSIKTGNEYIQQNINLKRVLENQRRCMFPSSVPEEKTLRTLFEYLPEKYNDVNSGYLDWSFIGKPFVEFNFVTPLLEEIRIDGYSETVVFGQIQGNAYKPLNQ